MTAFEIAIVFLGALAGGLVNGLTGFGSAMSAIGIWLYAISPTTAASLAIICSVVSQILTLPMIWRSIDWRKLAPFVIPGLCGVPIGTLLLPRIEPNSFKICIGLALIAYSSYVLARRPGPGSNFGGSIADGIVGFVGGILGGLTGLSGAPVVVWTDIRAMNKEQRRTVLQAFNLAILLLSLCSHAAAGLLNVQIAYASVAALPGTIVAAWIGSRLYLRLGNFGFQRVVIGLLLLSGVMLVWTSV